MFTQKRPERLVIGKVLDERAAQKPTSGGSSETEKKDPTVLRGVFGFTRSRLTPDCRLAGRPGEGAALPPH